MPVQRVKKQPTTKTLRCLVIFPSVDFLHPGVRQFFYRDGNSVGPVQVFSFGWSSALGWVGCWAMGGHRGLDGDRAATVERRGPIVRPQSRVLDAHTSSAHVCIMQRQISDETVMKIRRCTSLEQHAGGDADVCRVPSGGGGGVQRARPPGCHQGGGSGDPGGRDTPPITAEIRAEPSAPPDPGSGQRHPIRPPPQPSDDAPPTSLQPETRCRIYDGETAPAAGPWLKFRSSAISLSGGLRGLSEYSSVVSCDA